MMAQVKVSRRRLPLLVRIGAGLLTGLLIAAFVGVAGGAAWLKNAMREQLPVIDGQVQMPGLSAPVLVRRDTHGIPHIQAANMEDLLQAQGYVLAQDRLWQMDMSRRFAAGELAELLGSSVVEHDKAQRVLEIRPAAEHLASTMTADQRRLFEAFARGVNVYIDTHQNNLPAEFRLLDYKPRPWQPVDSWLVALNMVSRLDTVYPWKLERGVVESKLPPNLIAELYPTTTWRDHPPTQAIPDLTAPQQTVPPNPPGDESQSSLEDLLRLRGILRFASDACDSCKPGSNEWAVSGAHTASGKAMLSNDMHLEHSIPDIWHEEELQAGSFHVAGVTTPGIPFIIQGHNEHIAWGFTTLNGDVQDVYVEKTNGQGEYWAGNGWRQPEHDQEHIHVRFGKDVTLDVERTEHGPVITPLLPHETRMLSLKWVLYSPDLHGLPLQAMNSASNWTEFRQALSEWWGPTQNVAYADDQGHIGYQAVGLIPVRAAGPSGVPIVETGTPTDMDHEWQGFLDFGQLPSVADPDTGIVATANSRITPDGYPFPLALNWAAPYRNERIWKWLASHNKLTPADMLTLQMDTYSDVDHVVAQRLAYAIDRTRNADTRLRQAADLLRNWDGLVTTNSVAAEIVDAAKLAFWPLVLEPKLGADWKLYDWQNKDFVQEQMVEHGPPEWLPKNYQDWDALLVAAVQQGMLDGHAPPAQQSLSTWTFGSRHVINVQHPLYAMLPFFRSWTSTGPTQMEGDETTVNHLRGLLGASQRLTVDWGNVNATENIVIGESGDPLSPYYLDQWPIWLHGQTFALPFGDAAVSASTSHTLKLAP